jgi:hypothetical protein
MSSTVAQLTRIWRNPLFRRSVSLAPRAAWLRLLLLTGAAYVGCFLLVRFVRGTVAGDHTGPQLTAAFDYAPWMAAGAVFLWIATHGLLPYLTVRTVFAEQDLPSLNLILAARLTVEEILEAQVAAGATPSLAGLLPLLAALPVLAYCGAEPLVDAGIGLWMALLWGCLAAGLSICVGCQLRPERAAVRRSYALLSAPIPAAIVAVSLGVGYGCSRGHPQAELVFGRAALLTWSLLVIGTAAVCWDLAITRMLPDRRHPLCDESEVFCREP